MSANRVSVLLVVAGVAAGPAWTQNPPKASASTAAKAQPSGVRWSSLSNAQRLALKPLASSWVDLGEAQQRKWIALSRNFSRLPATEQHKLQQRMLEWVGLSAAERSLARLNYAETERLASDNKQARWEAYQALSEDERRKLAEQAPRRPLAGGATALRPIPRQRLATMPVPAENRQTMPRITIAPHLINPTTLLPQVDSHATDPEPARAP